MSGYAQGVRVEHAVIHDLTDSGYDCTRAASSKGSADVIAFKPGQCLLVNVKRTTPPGPAERAELLRVASHVDAVPLVALGPVSRVTYRRLTGHGPSDWVPWVPDEVAREASVPCHPRCTLGPDRDHPGYLEYRCIDEDVNALPFPGEVAP